MKRSLRILSVLAGAVAGYLANTMPSTATTIFDTTPSWDGSSNIHPFGPPNTATYGQTFVAPADDVLQSFTFYLEGSVTLQLQAQVYAWSGNLIAGNAPQGATGPALFTSAPITVGPTGVDASGKPLFIPITAVTGGLSLASGSDYVALFTVSGPDATDFTNSTGTDVWGGILSAHDPNNGGGGFVYDNNGNNYAALTTAWDSGADYGDSAWTAVFTESSTQAVPEPTTLSLFGFGLVAAAALRRRKKRA